MSSTTSEEAATARLEALCAKFERDEARLRQQALKHLHELRNWVVVARVVFVLLVGGTIVGWQVYTRHIDSVVAERVTKGQRFTNAVALAVGNDWHGALAGLRQVNADLPPTSTIELRDFKRYVLTNTLWVLANIEELTPERQWVGRDEWRTLANDPDFRTLLDLDSAVKDDPWIAAQRGWCLLKYETRPDPDAMVTNRTAIAGAKKLLEYSLQRLPLDKGKGWPHLGRGMIAILENDDVRGIQHLQCAALRDSAVLQLDELRTHEAPREMTQFWAELGKRMYGQQYDFPSTWSRIRPKLIDPSESGVQGSDCHVLETEGIVVVPQRGLAASASSSASPSGHGP